MNDYILNTTVTEQNRRGKIRMYPSGRYVNPLQLRAADLDIKDIAHHLSIVNRYTGATPFPYSVAQHSVWVSRQFKDRDIAFAGLMHDTAEAFFNDMASPLKHTATMRPYVDAITVAEKLIFATFGIDWSLMAAIKGADEAAFRIEVKSFLTPELVSNRERIQPMTFFQARDAFLTRYVELRGYSLVDRPMYDINRPVSVALDAHGIVEAYA